MICVASNRHGAAVDFLPQRVVSPGDEGRKPCRNRPSRDNCSISCSAASSPISTASNFKDLDKLDIVGIYPNYATAYAAWKAKAQQTVDNAQMRYFIVHLHRLLDPRNGSAREQLTLRAVAMSWIKRLVRSRAFQKAAGIVAAEYLRLVWKTNRFVLEPETSTSSVERDAAGHRRHVARPAFPDAVRQARRTTASRC